MWTLPLLILATTIVLAIPLGLFMAGIFDGRFRAPQWLRWLENRLDTGPQNWKQYAVALLLFNVMIFIVGFAILALQPLMPLNDNKKMLSPTTIFNTLCSFLSNTNLQHYSGEVHLSYFSQLFFVCWMQFITPAIGLCALLAIIRGLRGDANLGNYYVDLWRSVVYFFLPLSLILAVVLIGTGVPMTLEANVEARTLEPGAMGSGAGGQPTPFQIIARGPVAPILAIKQLGTNGGGFFGANCCHPFENPDALSNFLCCLALILVPIASLVMFGKMLSNWRHGGVIFGVMLLLSAATIIWAVYHDSMRPNPALTAQSERTY
jgi:potassium-transporting ATPase potassium-binding subunit